MATDSVRAQALARAGQGWVIEPRRPGMKSRALDLWRYRRLLRFFAKKGLEKQYKRTVLGASWLLIRPLFPLFIKTLVFGGLLAVASDGVPYFLFLVVGSTVWELFSAGVMWGTRSLDLNRGLLTRLYIPRLILPIAMMTPALITFVIHLAVIAGALMYFRMTDQVWYVGRPEGLLWAVASVVCTILLALGIALWTSVPALQARDVRFTMNYVLGFWVFLTPVFYPMSTVPPRWQPWMALNPMAVYCQMFKAGVIPTETPALRHVLVALGVTFAVGMSGLWYFNRAEADAADRV